MAHPTMPDIAANEKVEINLRRQAAARYFYKRAKQATFAGSALALGLALSAPLVLLFLPSLGPALGAIAGGWIFVTRFGIERVRREWQLKGVRAQEAFDCDVLGIEWNRSLGRPLPPEEIRAASTALDPVEKKTRWWRKKSKVATKEQSWYPSEGNDSWPISVLICQRSNAVWASRQHRLYSYVITGVTIGWGTLGIVVALLHGAPLSEYLTTILLPSLPGLLDATEMSSRHFSVAVQREEVNEAIEELLEGDSTQDAEIREIQDRLFSLRRDGVQVPEFFYKYLQADYERDMQFGAAETSAAASRRRIK
jgi:hypothetical protein